MKTFKHIIGFWKYFIKASPKIAMTILILPVIALMVNIVNGGWQLLTVLLIANLGLIWLEDIIDGKSKD